LHDPASQILCDRVEIPRSERLKIASLCNEGIGDGTPGNGSDLHHVPIQPAIHQGQKRTNGCKACPMTTPRESDPEAAIRYPIIDVPLGLASPSDLVAKGLRDVLFVLHDATSSHRFGAVTIG
jgi:hypothetical protein